MDIDFIYCLQPHIDRFTDSWFI